MINSDFKNHHMDKTPDKKEDEVKDEDTISKDVLNDSKTMNSLKANEKQLNSSQSTGKFVFFNQSI